MSWHTCLANVSASDTPRLPLFQRERGSVGANLERRPEGRRSCCVGTVRPTNCRQLAEEGKDRCGYLVGLSQHGGTGLDHDLMPGERHHLGGHIRVPDP